MTRMNLTPSELLGKHVTFFLNEFDEKKLYKGVVKSVCLNLDGEHEILIDQDFISLESVQEMKITGVLV